MGWMVSSLEDPQCSYTSSWCRKCGLGVSASENDVGKQPRKDWETQWAGDEANRIPRLDGRRMNEAKEQTTYTLAAVNTAAGRAWRHHVNTRA